jgi:cytochrome bd-type quinol oxidase subunit 2
MDKKQIFTAIMILVIGGILAGFSVGLPFIVRPNADVTINLAIARTSLSALTIPIVLFVFISQHFNSKSLWLNQN